VLCGSRPPLTKRCVRKQTTAVRLRSSCASSKPTPSLTPAGDACTRGNHRGRTCSTHSCDLPGQGGAAAGECAHGGGGVGAPLQVPCSSCHCMALAGNGSWVCAAEEACRRQRQLLSRTCSMLRPPCMLARVSDFAGILKCSSGEGVASGKVCAEALLCCHPFLWRLCCKHACRCCLRASWPTALHPVVSSPPPRM
jgi:hypothetical protein